MTSLSNKAVASCVALFITYGAIFIIEFPIPIGSDEYPLSLDIQSVLQTGFFSGGYPWGKGYQIAASITLKILDLPYSATHWLSPIIGSVAAGFIFICIWLIVRDMTSNDYRVVFVIFTAMLVFGPWLGRMREAGHKGYTFTLVFMALLSMSLYLKSESERRVGLLFFLFVLVLSTINALWGVVYGIAVATPVLFIFSRRIILVFSAVSTVSLFLFLPWVPSLRGFLVSWVIRPFSGTGGAAAGGGSLSLIETWGYTTIGPFSLSIWWVTISGFIMAASLGAVGGLFVLRDWYEKKHIHIVSTIVGPVSVIGVIISYFTATGGLVTLKRLIAVPVVICIAYLGARLSVIKFSRDNKRDFFFSLIIFILMISTVLALPRATTDGNINPYDQYISEKEFESVKWTSSHGGLLYPESYKYGRTVSKYDLKSINQSENPQANLVYSNGGNVSVYALEGSN